MIPFFIEGHHWLNNNSPSPLRYERHIFTTVAHAFQAARTHDEKIKREIASLPLGSNFATVAPRIIQRSDFNGPNVMEELLAIKFGLTVQDLNVNAQMYRAKKLIQTGLQVLEYGNHTCETFWGMCHCTSHQIDSDLAPIAATGTNALGKMLMKVRNIWRLYVEETNTISAICEFCDSASTLHVLYTSRDTPTSPTIVSACLDCQAKAFMEAAVETDNELVFAYNPFEEQEDLGSFNIADYMASEEADKKEQTSSTMLSIVRINCPHCNASIPASAIYCTYCHRQVNFTDRSWMGHAQQNSGYQKPTITLPPERTYETEEIIC